MCTEQHPRHKTLILGLLLTQNCSFLKSRDFKRNTLTHTPSRITDVNYDVRYKEDALCLYPTFQAYLPFGQFLGEALHFVYNLTQFPFSREKSDPKQLH